VATERNAKLHLAAVLAVIMAGWWFSISTLEWAILVLTIVCVLAAEAFNTAIEQLTDLVSPDYHPLAGKVKDLAAGSVLLCAIGAVVVGILLFLPKILSLSGK
jgi:diacylglycerol kinase